MPSLHKLIEEQVSDYIIKKVTITDQYQFSQYETLNQIESFWHSRYTSGQTDSKGNPKPFFNITKGKTNIAVRATDIDRKDISIKETQSRSYFRAFVASKYNHHLMNKMRFNDYLNDWGERLPRYGSVVTKIVEQDGQLKISIVDWQNFVCDPVDFNSAPHIEKLTLTPSELRKRTKGKNGYNSKAVEDLIHAKRTPRKNLKGQTVYEDVAYITVYEVHGEMEVAYLKDNPKDEDYYDYQQQMQVVAWHTDEETGNRTDFTLYRGKEKKSPYSISHWTKADGRTLGVGVVEDMFEPQIWHNYNILKMKNQIDLASVTIMQTSDGNLAARNVLSNMQNGDLVIHAVNQPITPVNVAPQGVEATAQIISMWKTLADEITSTPDAIQGSTMPSGTAFRQVAMLNTEAHSYFDYITECKGNYLEYLYREWIIPYIKKQLSNSDEIVALLSAQEVEFFDNAVADITVTKELQEQTLKGNIVSPIQLDQLRTQKLQDLKRTGAKRFLHPGSSTWKDYFKDFEWEVDINITGEAENKQTTIDTLFNALQVVAANPGILQDPTTKMLFMRLLEATDIVSPIEIQNAQSQPQPQMAQLGQQPQQKPQGNLQGGVPGGTPAPVISSFNGQ